MTKVCREKIRELENEQCTGKKNFNELSLNNFDLSPYFYY